MTREISATEADRSTARFRPEKEPIVIIGIGCRYPGGVKDVETFWQLLVAPGVGSQTKMLHEAYRNAGVDPSRVEIIDIPSSHEGVFHKPDVYQLAEKLKSCLG